MKSGEFKSFVVLHLSSQEEESVVTRPQSTPEMIDGPSVTRLVHPRPPESNSGYVDGRWRWIEEQWRRVAPGLTYNVFFSIIWMVRGRQGGYWVLASMWIQVT